MRSQQSTVNRRQVQQVPGASGSEAQEIAILNHLLSGESITPMEALMKFGCFRLSARIYYIRHELGHEVKMERVTCEETGNKYAKYTLVS